MRSGSKRLMIGIGTFLIAAAMVAPSFAGKKAVSDDELDLVTAAGQPVIVESGGTQTVTFTPTTSIAQTIQTNSQNTLRALALNNVAGENQVANGININGATGASSLSQTNTITQSWGSTADITISSSAGATAAITVDCAGALICKSQVSVAQLAATSARRLSRTADVIIDANGSQTVTYAPNVNIQATIDPNSQGNLVALVVNNVTGLNQVGNGVNILAGGVTLNSSGVTILGTGGSGAPTQANNLAGYRGTPANFTRIP